jgi:hypothetical protein
MALLQVEWAKHMGGYVLGHMQHMLGAGANTSPAQVPAPSPWRAQRKESPANLAAG